MNNPNTSAQHRDRPETDGHVNLPAVVTPHASEARDLAGLVADSFFLLPPSIWLVKEPDFRAPVMRDYFHVAVEHALEPQRGHVGVLADRSAVAVWFDHTRDLPAPTDYEQRRARACGTWTERFVYLDGLFARHHPRHAHHYLAFLAVSPYHQNTGRGSKLLTHHHRTLDTHGIPSYLEAASQRLVPFYERHGYHAGDPFVLAADGPPFVPMHRTPLPV